jgi:alkaline phosphatase
MREAANKGHPVGVVNDGDLPEPGTGAFLAEVARRGEGAEILEQMIFGRPGMNDRQPAVLLGGGEGFALPAAKPQCAAGAIADDCYLHTDPVTGAGPEPAATSFRRLRRLASSCCAHVASSRR